MRPEEEFVGRSLVDSYGGPSVVAFSDGEDPPDLYLSFSDCRVGVEVTRLSQFTIEPDGTLGNRATQDDFAVRIANSLDAELGPSVSHGMSLHVIMEMPVSNAAQYRKGLRKWVSEFARSATVGVSEERVIAGSKTRVAVIPARPSGKRIVGTISNKHSSPDIGLNARLILQDRIREKAGRCRALNGRIWLALLNDYWLADAETYAGESRKLSLNHCFERVFVVSGGGAVSELFFA